MELYGLGISDAVRREEFTRGAAVKLISIVIRGKTRQECLSALNELLSVCETDISANKPGKLWLDGQYLKCYLGTSSEIEEWAGGFHFMEKKLKILSPFPFWITEKVQRFRAGTRAVSSYGKKYAGRYPYQYGTGYANEVLFNDHFADTPAIVTIYGPCAEPKIYIGGNVYGVEANAEEGERIVLDQIERKIYRLDSTGTTTNLFDYRIKTSDPFKKISPGDVTVQFSGEFGFDIELLQQRSEPKWI